MKFNIHLLSHPIIQSLSSIAINKPFPSNIVNQSLKQLGSFIIYESLRKWLKIYTITIQKTNQKKTITIIDPKESYIIISNEIEYLSFFQEIQLLISKCELKFISRKDARKETNQIKRSWINTGSKIIITVYDFESEYISSILSQINQIQQIHVNKIYIICIKCKTKELVKVSKLNSKLNIYTTKIVNN